MNENTKHEGTEVRTNPLRALVVASDANKRRPLVELLGGRDNRVSEAESIARAWQLLSEAPFDLVVAVDEVLGGAGKPLVAAIRAFDDAIAVVAVVDSAEQRRQALADGAYDVFSSPVDRERFAVVVGHIGEAIRLRARSAVLDQMMNGGAHLGALLTRDPHMIAIVDSVRRLARYGTPVLIVGERGTEHEEVARALHDLGRPDGSFVALGAASLTVAELRANQTQAAGGTLFLDDVTALAADVGAALTALLEGPVDEAASRARLAVGYPHAEPPKVDAGDPRSELYRHLLENVLLLSPLRNRRGDAVLVARELIAGIGRDRGRDLAIARPVEDALCTYQWPGNLDELKTVVAVAATAANGPTVELHDLPPPVAEHAGSTGQPVNTRRLRDLEIQHLRQVIEETRGNKSRAARILGLSRWALQRKLRKHGITLEGGIEEESSPANES